MVVKVNFISESTVRSWNTRADRFKVDGVNWTVLMMTQHFKRTYWTKIYCVAYCSIPLDWLQLVASLNPTVCSHNEACLRNPFTYAVGIIYRIYSWSQCIIWKHALCRKRKYRNMYDMRNGLSFIQAAYDDREQRHVSCVGVWPGV